MKNKYFRFFLFSIVYAYFGKDGARGQTPVFEADCPGFGFSFSATGRQPTIQGVNGYLNSQGCNTWIVTYYSTGFSALSLRLDSAEDASGVPGSWGAFSGTLQVGINPNTATTHNASVITGNPPWVSINLVSKTGTGSVRGIVYGKRVPGLTFTSASGGSIAANVTIVNPLGQALMAASIPVVFASNQSAMQVGGQAADGSPIVGNPVLVAGWDGANVQIAKVDAPGNQYQFSGCTSQAEVSLSGTGYVEIVAGTASQVIRVCKVFVTSAAAGSPVINTFSVARATVTTCGTATELLSAASVTGIDLDFGGAMQSGSGQSICVSESTANSDKVSVFYSKF